MNPIIAWRLNLPRSGTVPNQSFLGLEFMVGEPNLMNPMILSVFSSKTIHFIDLPGIESSNTCDIVICNLLLYMSLKALPCIGFTLIFMSLGCMSKLVNRSSSGPMPGNAAGSLDNLSNFTLTRYSSILPVFEK